jgi:hypothetical protein
MNGVFWWGILIGALLSLAASIAANLLHSKIIELLERTKLLSHGQRRKRERRFYRLICRLNSGKFDKYFYVMTIMHLSHTTMLLSAIFQIGAALISQPYWEKLGLFDLIPWSPTAGVICAFELLSFMFLLMSMRLQRRARRIIIALDYFDQFKKEYLERWPEETNDSAGDS